MKKFAKLFLIVLMLATCIFAVTACNDDKDDNKLSISIEAANMPQTVFVLGNELDLSKGKLTVKKGSESSEVALNAEGVEVAGYDKNTLGDQTLTITYGGESTTLVVKVVERMTMAGYRSDYVLGEQFNDIGRLTIVRDNGESFSTYFNDDNASFECDMSSVGEKTVNVKYQDGNAQYSSAFKVTVYSPEKITMIKPQKTEYMSHEESVDCTYGSFYVTFKNGTQNTTVKMTNDMVSGFNANVFSDEEIADNSQEKKEQTLTVKYPITNQTYTYKITIALSDVTKIRYDAKVLSSLDWTGAEAATPNDEQGERAVLAMQRYFALSDVDKAALYEKDMLAVARPATVYAYAKWAEQVVKYKNLFELDGFSLNVVCETYQVAKDNLPILDKGIKDDNDILIGYGNLLADTAIEFVEADLYKGKSIVNYLYDQGLCRGSDIERASKNIGYMIEMYKELNGVTAKNYKELDTASAQIVRAYKTVEEFGTYTQGSLSYRYLFNMVTEWRKEGLSDEELKDYYNYDYFMPLYLYYYDMYNTENTTESAKGQEAIITMANICMPGELEVFFNTYANAVFASLNMQSTEESPVVDNIDTISFVRYFRNLVELENKFYANQENEPMILDLYQIFYSNNERNYIIDLLLGAEGIGGSMFGFMGSAYEIKEFEDMWTKYIDAVKAFALIEVPEGGELSFNIPEIKTMVEAFVALTPELQTQFVSSLNPYGSPELIIYMDLKGRSTMFSTMLFGYYKDVFTNGFEDLYLIEGATEAENKPGIVLDLLEAVEYYLLRNEPLEGDEQFLDMFLKTMGKVEEAYKALDVSKAEKFDSEIGNLYSTFDKIFTLHNELYDEEGKVVENAAHGFSSLAPEMREEIRGLVGMLLSLKEIYTMIYLTGEASYYPVYISIYERAARVYERLTTDPEVDENVKNYLLYTKLPGLTDKEDVSEDDKGKPVVVNAYIGTLLAEYRSYYMICLAQYPIGQYAMVPWRQYISDDYAGLRDYMALLCDLYYASMSSGDVVTDEEMEKMIKEALAGFYGQEDTANPENSIKGLTDDEKSMFVMMDGYGEYMYYNILLLYFYNMFDKENKDEVAERDALVDVLTTFIGIELSMYGGDMISVTKEQFIANWDKFIEDYDKLSKDNRDLFDEYFAKAKSLYQEEYDKVYKELNPDTDTDTDPDTDTDTNTNPDANPDNQ